jgi:pyrroloquinoline-quinone synthase
MNQLDELIQQKHMLLNPFYQAWSCGELTHHQLQDYAKNYYHHVKAFPTYLSALHSRCEDLAIRKSILNNLIDEEGATPTHPDLWMSFILSLGVNQEEIHAHRPTQQTEKLIQAFRKSCSSSLVLGIAALYCYESQIPQICQTKIRGLKMWYGVTNFEDYRYFLVHETADIEHSQSEKKLLSKLISYEQEGMVLKEATHILDCLNTFLSAFLD